MQSARTFLPACALGTVFAVASLTAAAGTATLTYVEPSQRTDGSSLDNLAQVRLYASCTQGGPYTRMRSVPPGSSSVVLRDLPDSTVYFVATAVDGNALESAYSNEASKVMGTGPCTLNARGESPAAAPRTEVSQSAPAVAVPALSASAGGPGEMVLTWTMAATGANGGSADVRSWRFHHGDSPGDYDSVIPLTDPAATTVTLRAPPGTYYITLSAVDADGVEGALSNEVEVTVQ